LIRPTFPCDRYREFSMRQQAKPFTVEVKKSRKSATEHQPLFGFLGDTALAEPPPRAVDANDKLFGRRPDPAQSAEATRVFGNGNGHAAPERPANRILPDLTAKPVAPVVEEAPKPRKPRASKPKAERAPKPLPVSLSAEPARWDAQPVAVAPVRVRRRAKDESGLTRAERWKRRLPRHAR
jgi:hypothetical protein